MEQIVLSQVVGTLRYGEFDGQKYSKNHKKFVVEYVVSVAVVAVVMFCVVIGLSVNQVFEPFNIGTFVAILFTVIVVGLSLITIETVLFLRKEKIRKAILKWGKDAIEVYAHSKCVGEQGSGDAVADLINGPSFAKIEVKFELNGKRYTKMSGKTGRLGTDDGFSRIWLKYRDRAIRIMYSLKYDQVIVLKDKENN